MQAHGCGDFACAAARRAGALPTASALSAVHFADELEHRLSDHQRFVVSAYVHAAQQLKHQQGGPRTRAALLLEQDVGSVRDGAHDEAGE